MSSDNEEDDLEALRAAALATRKQKVQPIENVFRGGNTAQSSDSGDWSDVPASIDVGNYADPMPEPELNNYPQFFGARSHDPRPPRHIRPGHPWRPPHPHHQRPPFNHPRFNAQPRFPTRSFGDRHGPSHDRGNRRLRRGYLPQQAPLAHVHPTHSPVDPITHNSSGPLPPMGHNLIVIRPHISQQTHDYDDRSRTPPFAQLQNQTARMVPQGSNVGGSKSSTTKEQDQLSRSSALVLPQDKYHSSVSTSKSAPSSQEVKSKDKFSRYDKSDSDDDDSEVDDIAKEIDKVLEDDFLSEAVTTQEASDQDEKNSKPVAEEESSCKEKAPSTLLETETEEVLDYDEDVEEESVVEEKEEDKEEVKENQAEVERVSLSPSKLETDKDSDTESLDLDQLVSGDFEDLDSLVDKEPDSLEETVIKRDICAYDRLTNLDLDYSKDSVIHSPRERKLSPPYSSERKPFLPSYGISLSPKPMRSLSPRPIRPNSPARPPYPRRYPSPRRSNSPYGRQRSISPRLPPRRSRSRSPYFYRPPLPRRSRSPRPSPPRRHIASNDSHADSRRGEMNLQHSTGPRRRSLSPNRRMRSFSPRDRYRERRLDRGQYRLDQSHRDGRGYRNRPRSPSRDKPENQSKIVNDPTLISQKPGRGKEQSRTVHDSGVKVDSPSKNITPLVDKSQESVKEENVEINLEKLTPEIRAKIEARRKKFDSREEVKVTEAATKTISLKGIKKREKKTKKKDNCEGSEVSKVEEEALPDGEARKKTAPAGISLKKLRKQREEKNKIEEEEEIVEEAFELLVSPKNLDLADLDDESEHDSDDGRGWRKGNSKPGEVRITLNRPSSTKQKAALVSLESIVPDRRRGNDGRDRGFRNERNRDRGGYRERRERVHQPVLTSNRWSSDDEDSGGHGGLNRLTSGVASKRNAKSTISIPPEKLRIQVQVSSKPKESRKKSEVQPVVTTVHSVPVKRHAEVVKEEEEGLDEDEEEMKPVVKKAKKKKEKKKKHLKQSPGTDEEEIVDPVASPVTKTSVLDRLGKKVSLEKMEKKGKKEKKKKKHKADRYVDEDTKAMELDLHIRKMKAKNEEIVRRRREIELDKERYG